MRMRLAFSYILIATTTNLSFFPALFGTRASSRAAISSLVVRAMSSSSSTTPNRTAPTATAGSRDGALIFLHGLGDSPAGWSSLKQNLPRWQPRLANIEYVFPAAPTIPISINGGGTFYPRTNVLLFSLNQCRCVDS